MQVTKEPLDPCQVALTIEVEPDKVVQAVDRAYREYAKYVAVPGFRKGKAPMSFVRQRVPEADVRQRTAELLVEPAYNEALEQESVQPYAPPKLELVQLEFAEKPFIFKALVPLAPQIVIGPYTGLQVERSTYELSDDAMNAQIQKMAERAADFPLVDRPAEMGDLVVAELSAKTDIRPEAAEPRPTMLEIGSDNIPGFDEQIIGVTVGDEKTFTLTYPDNYPDEELAGEEAEFTIKVNEIRTKDVPPVDDDLAKKITNGKMETLEALKTEMRSDMEKSMNEAADRGVENKIIDQIIAGSTIKYPPVLVEAEVDDDARQLMARLEQQQATLDDYLKQTGKTREQLMAELQQAAEQRIRVGLILGEIAERESLSLSDDDLEAALAERAEQQQTTPAAMRALLEANNAMDGLRNRAQTKKVLDFLRGSAIIEEKVVSPEEAASLAQTEEADTDTEADESE